MAYVLIADRKQGVRFPYIPLDIKHFFLFYLYFLNATASAIARASEMQDNKIFDHLFLLIDQDKASSKMKTI
jgi:hypothetical protein